MNESSPVLGKPRRRWPLWLGAVLTALVVAVGVGEGLGWPFLAGPLERWLSSTLDRPVRIASAVAPDGHGATAFNVRFLGGVRVRAAEIEIAAPAWSKAPHMLLAQDVTLALRYTDLWRAYRGETLRIHRLEARTLDGELERLADGRNSWQFRARPEADPARPLAAPRFGRLRVNQGTLRYRDEPLGAQLQARMQLVDGEQPAAVAAGAASSASAASEAREGRQGGEGGEGSTLAPAFSLSASGTYRRLPVKIELASAGVLPWVVDEAPTQGVPVKLDATVGRATLAFRGSATDALHLNGLSGSFDLRGSSLAAVGDPVGVTLPTTAAFRMRGQISRQGELWDVTVADATIGASRLNGKFRYESGLARPVLSGRLGGQRLMLVDLGPVVGTTPAVAAVAAGAAALPAAVAASAPLAVRPTSAPVGKALAARTQGPGKVLPDRPFDLAALRVMDADVQIGIAEVDLNSAILQPLRPMSARLKLVGGVLTLNELEARTAQGRLTGELRLDGRTSLALWNADLRWSGVQLERWITQARADGAPPYVSGRLNGTAVLQGQGRSTADILGSLKGKVHTELQGGAVSHLAIEAAGIDIAQSLGVLIKGDDALPVLCAVAQLEATDGVLRPRVMVVDTGDSAVWVQGSVSMVTEALDLRVVVMPKDFSPLTLRTPLLVRGTFAKPEVSLEKGRLAGKLGTALLLGLVSPLAALIPLIDPGDPGAAQRGASGCQALAARTAPRPVAAPAKAR